MKLAAIALLIGCLLGLALGGRFSGLSRPPVRWSGLALAGLVLQVLPLPAEAAGAALWLLLLSFAVLLVFCIGNLRAPGFPLIVLGLLLNLAVIAPNGGMPVSRTALVASGQADTLEALASGRAVKHHLAGEGDVLAFLGDVIAIGPPVRQVLSVGDLATASGLAWLVAASMRRERRPERRADRVAQVAA
ncbi:MAG: DUF5317 family protein [Actinobacteria bacterium]|nr:DUF5317 family protein [Actinomycetota bacterium]